jgi:hypothetical protein
MEEALRKIISRIIVKKYPWIDEFVVVNSGAGGINRYDVYYYVNPNLYNNSVARDTESATETLYNALGPSSSDRGVRVMFRFKTY